MQRQEIFNRLKTGFNFSSDESAVAFALLEQRSQSLHFETVGDYVDAFYPKGFVEPDPSDRVFFENLEDDVRRLIYTSGDIIDMDRPEQEFSYTLFRADFPAFLQASAISFRHQMPEDLKQQAETAFGVKDGKWTGEQTKMFALAFEEYVKDCLDPNGIKNIYKRAEKFTENMHIWLSALVIESNRVAGEYDSFFTDKKWHFDEAEYYKQIQALQSKSPKESSHQFIFLGMTAPIYQAVGFDRLPCFIDGASLQQVIDPWGFWYNIKHPSDIFKMPNVEDTIYENTIYLVVPDYDENMDTNAFAVGLYTIETDGQKNIITKIRDPEMLMEVDKALRYHEVQKFDPLLDPLPFGRDIPFYDEGAPVFFQNPYPLEKDAPAFYKNDQLYDKLLP